MASFYHIVDAFARTELVLDEDHVVCEDFVPLELADSRSAITFPPPEEFNEEQARIIQSQLYLDLILVSLNFLLQTVYG